MFHRWDVRLCRELGKKGFNKETDRLRWQGHGAGADKHTDQLHFPPSWPLLYLFLSIPHFLLPAHAFTSLHTSTSTPSTRTLGFAPVSVAKSQLTWGFLTVHQLVWLLGFVSCLWPPLGLYLCLFCLWLSPFLLISFCTAKLQKIENKNKNKSLSWHKPEENMQLRSVSFLQEKVSRQLPLWFLGWEKGSMSRGARERSGNCRHSEERACTAPWKQLCTFNMCTRAEECCHQL